MEKFRLEELTHEAAENLIKERGTIDIITKSGTTYHIMKVRGNYLALSHYCYEHRPLTKAMRKVFY